MSQSQAMRLLTSSQSDEWWTPPQYVEAARQLMGSIELDPASSEGANKIVRAKRYFTELDLPLLQEWSAESVWLNPPYGKTMGKSLQGAFSNKLVAEFEAERVKRAVLLVNAYFGYGWFNGLRSRGMCILDHRISFIDGRTGRQGDQAKASSVIITFGNNWIDFQRIFSKFGPLCFPRYW